MHKYAKGAGEDRDALYIKLYLRFVMESLRVDLARLMRHHGTEGWTECEYVGLAPTKESRHCADRLALAEKSA